MLYVSSWFVLAAIGISVFGPPVAFALGWWLRHSLTEANQ